MSLQAQPEDFTKNELVDLSEKMNLPTSGTKDQLCQRINVLVSMDDEMSGGDRLVYERNMSEEDKDRYFLGEGALNDMQKKYCRCILHTADKQPGWCLKDKAWYKKRDGEQCYNPYAVCTKSVGRKGPAFECVKNLDLDVIPESELEALAQLKGKSIDELYAMWREEMRQ